MLIFRNSLSPEKNETVVVLKMSALGLPEIYPLFTTVSFQSAQKFPKLILAQLILKRVPLDSNHYALMILRPLSLWHLKESFVNRKNRGQINEAAEQSQWGVCVCVCMCSCG